MGNMKSFNTFMNPFFNCLKYLAVYYLNSYNNMEYLPLLRFLVVYFYKSSILGNSHMLFVGYSVFLKMKMCLPCFCRPHLQTHANALLEEITLITSADTAELDFTSISKFS